MMDDRHPDCVDHTDGYPWDCACWRKRPAINKSASPGPQIAVSVREVEMMVALEHVADLLAAQWDYGQANKVINDLADEVTPVLEGLGMTLVEGEGGRASYGFDWTSEQETVEKLMGGRKAIFHRLVLETPTP